MGVMEYISAKYMEKGMMRENYIHEHLYQEHVKA